MKTVTFLATFLALGCDAQGLSLGREGVCVTDARILAAEERSGSALAPPCATIGLNQLVNDDMEVPAVRSLSECPRDFCQVNATQVTGWRTTSEAQLIEVWTDGYEDVPAAEGEQFVELDANTPDTLYQDVVLAPGQLVYWSVLHRGRIGVEMVELLLGPPDNPVSQGLLTSSSDDWQTHRGIYRVGDTEKVTRFALASRSGTTQGNFVDGAVLAPIEPEP